MSRDPHVRAIAQVHAARSDFDLPTCLAEMVHCLAAEKERLAMDLTTAKIDQIESYSTHALAERLRYGDYSFITDRLAIGNGWPAARRLASARWFRC